MNYFCNELRKSPQLNGDEKLAINGPINYKLNLTQSMNKDWHNITLTIEECYTTFILLPGHRTQCYKDDEVTGSISNHLMEWNHLLKDHQ